MPYLVVKAPPDPANNLGTSQETHSFVPPHPIADGDETELDLDLQGCNHAVISDSEYHGYVLQTDPLTLSSTFAMPGLESANALRSYLDQHLQPDQVVDEYGDKRDIHEISINHLAVLQAKIWGGASSAKSLTVEGAPCPFRLHVVEASHVSRITQSLEGKYSTCSRSNNIVSAADILQTSMSLFLVKILPASAT